MDIVQARTITVNALGNMLESNIQLENDKIFRQIIKKIEIEANSGSTFCHYRLSEPEYEAVEVAYLVSKLSFNGFKVKYWSGTIDVSWL